MTAPGPTALSRALMGRLEELAAAFFTQATVTAVQVGSATVSLPGSGSQQQVPTLRACPALAVGNTVWLFGPPGSWVCVGPIGPAGSSLRSGTVTGTNGNQVVVNVAGTPITAPRLSWYAPATGDTVLLQWSDLGWVVMGKVA